MTEIVKVALIGILSALLAYSLKEVKSSYSVYIALVASVIVFMYISGMLVTVKEKLEGLIMISGVESSYIKILLKMVGITYVCELSGTLCKDLGHAYLAEMIETFGKLSMIFVGFPVITELIKSVLEL